MHNFKLQNSSSSSSSFEYEFDIEVDDDVEVTTEILKAASLTMLADVDNSTTQVKILFGEDFSGTTGVGFFGGIILPDVKIAKEYVGQKETIQLWAGLDVLPIAGSVRIREVTITLEK